MKLLLDTHSFVWWASEPEKLPKRVLTKCRNPANSLFLSVASVWEMQIKLQLGKLKFDTPLSSLIEIQQQTNDIQIITIDLEHVLKLEILPNYHKDPFDRLLIAQSIIENAVLVSKDEIFSEYPV